MTRTVISLSVAALLAVGLILTGCNGEEKAKEPAGSRGPQTAGQPSGGDKPGPQQPAPPQPVAPTQPAPEPAPAPAPAPTTPEPAPAPTMPAPEPAPAPAPVTPPVPAPAPAPTTPAPEPAPPAATGEQKTPWDKAKVGDMMVYNLSGGMKQTYKVTAMDEKQATVQMTTVIGEITNSTDQKFDRVVKTAAAEQVVMPEGIKTETKDLGAETIKVGDQELKCKVTQTTTTMTLPTGTTVTVGKTWMCDDVPMGVVKSQSGPTEGSMETVMELVEFKRGA